MKTKKLLSVFVAMLMAIMCFSTSAFATVKLNTMMATPQTLTNAFSAQPKSVKGIVGSTVTLKATISLDFLRAVKATGQEVSVRWSLVTPGRRANTLDGETVNLLNDTLLTDNDYITGSKSNTLKIKLTEDDIGNKTYRLIVQVGKDGTISQKIPSDVVTVTAVNLVYANRVERPNSSLKASAISDFSIISLSALAEDEAVDTTAETTHEAVTITAIDYYDADGNKIDKAASDKIKVVLSLEADENHIFNEDTSVSWNSGLSNGSEEISFAPDTADEHKATVTIIYTPLKTYYQDNTSTIIQTGTITLNTLTYDKVHISGLSTPDEGRAFDTTATITEKGITLSDITYSKADGIAMAEPVGGETVYVDVTVACSENAVLKDNVQCYWFGTHVNALSMDETGKNATFRFERNIPRADALDVIRISEFEMPKIGQPLDVEASVDNENVTIKDISYYNFTDTETKLDTENPKLSSDEPIIIIFTLSSNENVSFDSSTHIQLEDGNLGFSKEGEAHEMKFECINHIPATNEAKPFPFVDVHEEDWFRSYVEFAYNMGLVNGKTEDMFEPMSHITFAEAIKIAACMNQLHLEGMVTLTASPDGNWYDSYMSYCMEKGIIDRDYSAQANIPINRRELVKIFYHSMPEEMYEPQLNSIEENAIPDVPFSIEGGSEIYSFYRAGILTGDDASLTFRPNDSISRAEVTAIITRIIEPGSRKTINQ